jgi:hypothetical protein
VIVAVTLFVLDWFMLPILTSTVPGSNGNNAVPDVAIVWLKSMLNSPKV